MSVGGVTSQQGNDLGPLINQYAAANGMPTRPLTAQLWAESRLDEHAERIGVWPDWSWGLSQITAAYAPVGDHTASPANVAFVRDYYFQPENAIRDCAAWLAPYWQRFSALDDEQRYLETASRYNGGPNLAFADNPNAANYAAAWERAAQYEQEAPMPTPTTRAYDPDYGTPAYQQREDWTCSVCSAAWAMGAVGEAVTPAQMEDAMVAAGLVDSSVGLHDGSGAALAAWLEHTYGVQTERAFPASWEWVQAHAGQSAVLMGAGQPWYHWVGVRRAVDANLLSLANSAQGYEGIGQVLTRGQFATLGTFAAIALTAEEDPAVIADLQAQLAAVTADRDALKVQFDALDSWTSSLTKDTIPPIVARLRALARQLHAGGAQNTVAAVADQLAPFGAE